MVDLPTLTLTHNEVLALLHMSGAPTMTGLREDAFAGFSQQQRDQHVKDGIITLLSRDLFRLEGRDRLLIDDAVRDVLRACVLPEAVLLLAQAQLDGSSAPYYFSATADGIVEHFSAQGGAHAFKRLPTSDALDAEARQLLAPLDNGASDNGAPQRISEAALTQLLQAWREQNRAEAQALLQAAGWPSDDASAMIEDGMEAVLWIGQAAWGLQEETPAGATVTLVIAGNQHCWLVQQVDQSPELSMRAASKAECEQALLELLEPLKATIAQPQQAPA